MPKTFVEIDTIRDIVYVKPEVFELKHTWEIVSELQRLNGALIDLQRPYLLIVLGRLGTTDPWLGIPVIWSHVSGAKVIVEATQENVRVELSQGSHYFHNILNLGVKYFTLPLKSQFKIDWEWLNEQKVAEETRFLKHIRLSRPLHVKADGLNSRGVICKAPLS